MKDFRKKIMDTSIEVFKQNAHSIMRLKGIIGDFYYYTEVLELAFELAVKDLYSGTELNIEEIILKYLKKADHKLGGR